MGLSIDDNVYNEDNGWAWDVGDERGGAWAASVRRADGLD